MLSPSRGLLRDCKTSPINRFAALDTTHESGQAGFKTLAFSEMCDAFSHVLGQGRKCCPLLVGSANFTLIQCLTCSDFALHNAHVEV